MIRKLCLEVKIVNDIMMKNVIIYYAAGSVMFLVGVINLKPCNKYCLKG